MKLKLYTLAILIVSSLSLLAQTPGWQWAVSHGGYFNEESSGIKADNYGYVYVSGAFYSDSLTIGSTTVYRTGPNIYSDAYLAKYDEFGNGYWVVKVGGTSYDGAMAVTTDNAANSYLTGYTVVNGQFQVFINKYDFFGNVVWSKTNNEIDMNVPNAITIDTNNNIYVTGVFSSPTITFDGITLTRIGTNQNIFVTKYDSSGTVIWAKNAGSTTSDLGEALSIAVDADGNSYITGYFSGNMTFDSYSLNSGGAEDIFVAKYDSSGNVLWAKSVGSSAMDEGRGISLDATGNVYVTGLFNSVTITFGTTVLTNNGSYDIFIAKFDSSGNSLWTKNFGGSGSDNGYALTTDSYGNSYLTGNFNSPSISFDSTTLIYVGINDPFFLKCNTAGDVLWATSVGNGSNSYQPRLSLNAMNNIYVTGAFEGTTLTFGSNTVTNGNTSGFNEDVYIAKLECTTFSSNNVNACNSFTSPSGNYTWTTSGTYQDTIPNALGCDSIIFINLAINTLSTSSTISPTACSSYTSPSGNYTWASSGIYQDTIPNAMGCDSIITINLTINPLPVTLYTLYPSPTPHNWYALNQCTGIPTLTYVWNWGDSSAVSTGATPSHTYSDSGYYNICVTVTDGNGCVNAYCDSSTYIYKGNSNSMVTLSVVMSLPNGIEDIDGNSSINIYPDPVNDVMNVSLNKRLTANTKITISDLQGRIVKEEKIIQSNGSVISINASALSQGVYLLRVNGVVKRFVKL